jgi:hypothetical protein
MSEIDEEKERIQKKITNELTPLLDNLLTKKADYELFERAFRHFQVKFNKAIRYGRLFAKYATRKKGVPPSLKDTAYALFSHVVLVESLGNSILDMIVMLLVANGKEFHIHKRGNIVHVNKMGELENIPLGRKVSFLENNEIKEIAGLVNTTLRNKISHLKFKLKEDNIYIEGKPAYEIATTSSNKLVFAVIHTKSLLDNLAKNKGLLPKDYKTYE